ncbi:unnamed protein product [Linum trigynum]|uniref:Secreted protein n=1 Tax=Linum trigynum TaxID=586398 RepID=A0AAV2CPN7_9ROSI
MNNSLSGRGIVSAAAGASLLHPSVSLENRSRLNTGKRTGETNCWWSPNSIASGSAQLKETNSNSSSFSDEFTVASAAAAAATSARRSQE